MDRYAATLILEVVLVVVLSGIALVIGDRVLEILGVAVCRPEEVVVDRGLYYVVYRVGMRC